MGFASVAAENKTLLWDSTNSVAVGTATNTNRWEGAQSSSSLNSHVCVYVSSWSPPPQVHRDREGPASVSQSEMLLPGAVPSRVLSCDRWWRQPGSPSQTEGALAASKSCSLGPSSVEDAAGMAAKARRQI